MANSITLTEKFIAALDEVYSTESKTARLESDSVLVRSTDDGKTWKIGKLTLQGAGNYSRATGFPQGDVTLTWESFTFENDRGRSFSIDAMDDQEALNLVVANVLSTFLREKIVPEMDAVRFAKYFAGAGIKTRETISDAAAAKAALERDLQAQVDADVPAEGKTIFCSPAFYSLLGGSVSRVTMNGDGTINQRIKEWDGNAVVQVPSARFNTAVKLADGTTLGQEAGGYTATGKTINYMIIDRRAVVQITKHVAIRAFSPDVNQKADAWKIDYRVYHDAWVLANKTKGIAASAPADD